MSWTVYVVQAIKDNAVTKTDDDISDEAAGMARDEAQR